MTIDVTPAVTIAPAQVDPNTRQPRRARESVRIRPRGSEIEPQHLQTVYPPLMRHPMSSPALAQPSPERDCRTPVRRRTWHVPAGPNRIRLGSCGGMLAIRFPADTQKFTRGRLTSKIRPNE